eukprot:1161212-Pelagomonas_calceolata.AAC.10
MDGRQPAGSTLNILSQGSRSPPRFLDLQSFPNVPTSDSKLAPRSVCKEQRKPHTPSLAACIKGVYSRSIYQQAS